MDIAHASIPPLPGHFNQLEADCLDGCSEKGYDPPFLTDLGDLRELTLGNSSSGNADANSQYYW
jgi:hypothetical protein